MNKGTRIANLDSSLDSNFRHNHYVPVWYQRGFLLGGNGEHLVFNKNPNYWIDIPGKGRMEIKGKEVQRRGPIKFLEEKDLYTTSLLGLPNTEIERFLFGPIDKKGKVALDLFCNWPYEAKLHMDLIPKKYGEPNERMMDFIEYLDAQKIRTPKGLALIKNILAKDGIPLTQNNLMKAMQEIREIHSNTWAEGFWELVSAENSNTKFIFSDDPVTFYNCDYFPGSEKCIYPYDPDPFLIGTRIIFPLNLNNCLIISNIQHSNEPSRSNARKLRRNARSFDQAIISFLDIHKTRSLSETDVAKINYIVKTRAVRYVAAPNEEWLYPEAKISPIRWPDLDQVLHHQGFAWKLSVQESYIMTRTSVTKVNPYGERVIRKRLRI